MRECPRCGAAYDDGLRFCPDDGAELVGAGDETLTLGRDAQVLGSYRLLQLLGQGGMGRVFLAEHVKLGRKVALKMLRPELAANAEAVRRFFAEARAVNQVAHENIVAVTDFFEADGAGQAPYLIMEFLEGESLRSLLDRGPVPALSRSTAIAIQLADALAAVHEAGIVHRDLKPDNVFLVERGGRADVVKILDFGVAKLRSAGDGRSMLHTAHGTVLGTPEYMAPEQAEATLKVDHRADVYALGVILYEMVSGKKPIVGSTISETLIKQLTWTPPLPSEAALDASIPVELEALIMRCLEKRADRRPRDMREVQASLRGVMQQLAGSTAPGRALPREETAPEDPGSDAASTVAQRTPPQRPPSPPGTAPAAPPKNASAIVAVALAAVSLAIAAGGLWYLLRPQGTEQATQAEAHQAGAAPAASERVGAREDEPTDAPAAHGERPPASAADQRDTAGSDAAVTDAAGADAAGADAAGADAAGADATGAGAAGSDAAGADAAGAADDAPAEVATEGRPAEMPPRQADKEEVEVARPRPAGGSHAPAPAIPHAPRPAGVRPASAPPAPAPAAQGAPRPAASGLPLAPVHGSGPATAPRPAAR